MKPRFRPVLGVLFSVAATAFAQEPGTVPSAPTAPSLPSAQPLPVAPTAPGATAPALFTAEQLDQLLGPVALYPDALLALVLPASTNSAEVVLAARFLAAGRNPSDADAQPWDDSVRALVRYPATLRWMDDNLAWTKQLGDVFRAQPDDVMAAVQRLRARALAAGTLFSNAQQQVVVQGNIIEILPAQPDTIYVPTYDARVVYLERNAYPPLEATLPYFGLGFSMGPWLSYGLDWPARRIWVINRSDRERYWRDHRAARPLPPPPVSVAPAPGAPPPPRWHTWRPDPERNRYPGPPPATPSPSPRPRIAFPRNEVARPAPAPLPRRPTGQRRTTHALFAPARPGHRACTRSDSRPPRRPRHARPGSRAHHHAARRTRRAPRQKSPRSHLSGRLKRSGRLSEPSASTNGPAA